MSTYQNRFVYNSNVITPSGKISVQRVKEASPDGTYRTGYWQISIHIQIVAMMGSPNEEGVFWNAPGYPPDTIPSKSTAELRTKNLMIKMGAISKLFSEDGHWFEVQPSDGSASLKFQPTITDIKFEDGLWFNFVNCEIQCKCTCINFGTLAVICSPSGPAEETWTLEPLEEYRPTYKLTHLTSATGKLHYDPLGNGNILTPAWQDAQTAVLAATGYSAAIVTALGLTGANPYNYNKSSTIDEPAGKFSISETWILTSNPYYEDRITDIKYALDTNFTSVTVSGTIYGLNPAGSPTGVRYSNALGVLGTHTSGWALGVAQAESGKALNPAVMATTSARNKTTGVVGYSYEFNDRPATQPGFLTESIDVSVERAVDVIAEIGVINRSYGPVLQNIGSKTQQNCTVQYEGSVPVAYHVVHAFPTFDTLAIFNQYIGRPPTVHIKADRERYNPNTGRYTRTTTFIYQLV